VPEQSLGGGGGICQMSIVHSDDKMRKSIGPYNTAGRFQLCFN
jgi:hypothetical protein